MNEETLGNVYLWKNRYEDTLEENRILKKMVDERQEVIEIYQRHFAPKKNTHPEGYRYPDEGKCSKCKVVIKKPRGYIALYKKGNKKLCHICATEAHLV